jgi:UDP-glucose 4-epimerase
MDEPLMDASENILNTIRLLQACQGTRVSKFIFASSGGTVYGDNLTGQPFFHSERLNPLSPYGVSKMACEHYVFNMCKQWDITPLILRYSNVYGPRQNPNGESGVIGIFVNHAINEDSLLIYGDGQQIRDYIYISDVVDLNVAALKFRGRIISILDNHSSVAYNVGLGKSYSVNEIAQKVLNIVEPLSSKIVNGAPRVGELKHVSLDITRTRVHFGWGPAVSINDGINKTYDSIMTNEYEYD